MERRKFVTGCGSVLCGGIISPIGLLAKNNHDSDLSRICSTITSSLSSEFEIDNFSSSGNAIEIENEIKNLRVTDFGTAMLAQRWLKNDGLTPNTGKITLGIHFMNGEKHEQETVQNVANEWISGELGEKIAFKFGASIANSQIRIKFDPSGGNNSYVGRQALHPSLSFVQTMNIAQNIPSIVLHEFGHALGLRHEHRHPDVNIPFLEEVVIADMERFYGWSEVETRLNILTPLEGSSRCIGDLNPNNDSIMMYEIPAHWTRDGKAFSSADMLTERDIACIVAIYSIED